MTSAPARKSCLCYLPVVRFFDEDERIAMLRINCGKTSRYCDGVNRRNFLQVGMAGFGTLAASDILRAKEASVQAGKTKKDTSVILIWLDGGLSHVDTYDMKPDAPVEVRGIWSPIPTNVPGMEV